MSNTTQPPEAQVPDIDGQAAPLPHRDVPMSAPLVPTPQATGMTPSQASPPTEDQAISEMDQLANSVRAALRSKEFRATFEGKVLVTYRWSSPGGAGQFSIQLESISLASQTNAMPKFEFALTGTADKSAKHTKVPLDVQATVTAPSGTNDLRLRISITSLNTKKDLVLAHQDDAAPRYRDKTVLSPKNLLRANEFGGLWFPPSDAEKPMAGSVQVKRVEMNAALAGRWTTYRPETETWEHLIPGRDGAKLLSEEEWQASMIAFICWTILTSLHSLASDNSQLGKFRDAALPPINDYEKRSGRAVELSPTVLAAKLEGRHIFIPWQVLEAACTSLNSGKHLILTGPPGCGKTELATQLATLISRDEKEGIVATASTSWTTGDLIGRYFPAADGTTLEFRPGFFLRALEENRTLVIDEFNRARIDECFGELFTVFSGHDVELPFMQRDPKAPGGLVQVRVVSHFDDTEIESDRPLGTYRVPPSFRLIGTMNDADRADLAPLSFALLRRFDIIRLEAPPPSKVRELISAAMVEPSVKRHLAAFEYEFRKEGVTKGQPVTIPYETARDSLLLPLFAAESESGNHDLVSLRIVGVATVLDVVRFMLEGISCGSAERRRCEVSDHTPPLALLGSYIAMAVVLKVLPQLDSIDWPTREKAIHRILETFAKAGHRLVRLEPIEQLGTPDKAPTAHYRASVAKTGATPIHLTDYILEELTRHYRREHRDDYFEELRAKFGSTSPQKSAP